MDKQKIRRLTGILSFIFFSSGFAALIYQVVWQRLLTVYYGVGPVSTTLIVSIYMVGLGIGALFGGYLAEHSKQKIKLYFIVELLIGFFGLVSLPLLDLIGHHTAGSNYILSLVYMFAFLCIPTFLMGITLPLLTKIFNNLTRNFLGCISMLYFINTLGAAAGTVFASYVIISLFGLDIAALIAALINFLLAGIIFLLRNSAEESAPAQSDIDPSVASTDTLGRMAYVLVFITGFLAIGYEIVWFRVIGVLTKASPYAFSSVLSVYLLAVAIGSYGVNRFLQRKRNLHKKSVYFMIQSLIAVAVLGIFSLYYFLTRFTGFGRLTRLSFSQDLHPLFHIPSFESFGQFIFDLYALLDVFWWSGLFVLIPTLLMGASFPLISILALSRSDREGSTVGTVYFFNILGNVFGGLITGFMLLPILGTEQTLILFICSGAMFALFVTRIRGKKVELRTRCAFILVLLVLTFTVFPGKGRLYHAMHTPPAADFNSFLEEGVEGVIMTYQLGDFVRNTINGLGHGMRPGHIFYYETLKAMVATEHLRDVFILGFGTGSITEMIQKSDRVESITLVELNKALIRNLRKIELFRKILDDERIDLTFDDGRRYLIRSDAKYDLITTDPLRTTTASSNNLYSRQFFTLVRDHLRQDGIFMMWKDEHQIVPNTVHSVFDYVNVHTFFVLASQQPIREVPGVEETLLSAFSPGERQAILNSGAGSYIGDQTMIQKQFGHLPVNEDWKPVTEYYFGLALKKKWVWDSCPQ